MSKLYPASDMVPDAKPDTSGPLYDALRAEAPARSLYPASNMVIDKAGGSAAVAATPPAAQVPAATGRFYANSDHVIDTAAGSTDIDASGGSETVPPESQKPNAGVDSYTPTTPDHIAELRKSSMFDADATFRTDLQVDDHPELPPELNAAAVTELRRMAGDVGLSASGLREFETVGKANCAAMPSDEQQDEWQQESMKALSRKYGDQAHDALNLARSLIQRDPRLGTILETLALGDHPRVVTALVERAYAERKAGRLK